uniref:NSP1 n=1 Tax=Rotavirus A TaxID=28875 RepID=A0A1B1LZ99_9REOV|nr:NSP1 [Rotavirus A]
MSIYRDALYWYSRHIRTRNYRLLKNTSEFAWRHADLNEKIDKSVSYNILARNNNQNKEIDIISHCLVCCSLTKLYPCRVCNMVHTCLECLHTCECFMQNRVSQLRLRTLKYPVDIIGNFSRREILTSALIKAVSKEHLQNIIEFYLDTFPINENVLEISERKIKQGRCRNQLSIWANHLLLPICLTAKVIVVRDSIYLIFGVYEKGKEINAWYEECNFYNAEHLIDEHNFDRIAKFTSYDMQDNYARKAFIHTRKLNRKLVDCSKTTLPICYSALKYSERLNFIYTVSIRSSDALAISSHSEWNNLYKKYKQLLTDKKRTVQRTKREMLTVKSAIVFKYADSPMYITLLWDKLMSEINHKTLFCTHWFVDPVEPNDPICIHSKLSGRRTAIIHPVAHNMLYELHSIMKAAFSVGIYSLNGKYSCNNLENTKIEYLKEQLTSRSILCDDSNFTTFICTDKLLISDYSDFVMQAINQLEITLIPVVNMYTYREQKMIIACKSKISKLIHKMAKTILHTMLSGDFINSHTTNLYTRTDRYVAYAFDEIPGDSTSDVD